MSEFAFVSASTLPLHKVVAGFTNKQAVSGIISSCIKVDLLTHDLLPYRFESAGRRIARSLPPKPTLWQRSLAVRRHYNEASIFKLWEDPTENSSVFVDSSGRFKL